MRHPQNKYSKPQSQKSNAPLSICDVKVIPGELSTYQSFSELVFLSGLESELWVTSGLAAAILDFDAVRSDRVLGISPRFPIPENMGKGFGPVFLSGL